MANAPTSSTTPSALKSDDPLENAADWLSANRKPLTIAVAVVVVLALLLLGYRYMDNSKRAEASAALYRAAAPLQQGLGGDAESGLESVAKKYSGTSSGQQAALMLGQVRYDKGEYAAGVQGLEDARSSAKDEFEASFEDLIATGYAAQGKHEKAAEQFGKAAGAARFPGDQEQYKASQARELMAAGKLDEASKIWQELSSKVDGQYSAEAQIRLGEILGLKQTASAK